jgi:ABC-type nitrate/sulfonate/bicarbonate transport system substrate-binding protein
MDIILDCCVDGREERRVIRHHDRRSDHGMHRPRRGRRRAVLTATAGVSLALGVAACGSSGTGGSAAGSAGGVTKSGVPTINVVVTASEMPVAVAADQGLFKGLNVKYQMVGFDAKTPIFLKDQNMPITALSPVEVAQEIAKGEDIEYFSTTTGLYFWNGIVVRAKDAGTYKAIADLKGKTIGQPGFATGTWAAFAGIAKSLYGLNAKSDFKLVTADPGALLGLLQAGKIDAALTFAGQAATGLASPQFRLTAGLGPLWQQKTGQAPLVDGLAVRRSWLEKNPDLAHKFVAGVDAGVQWMKDHPDEFAKGGKYEKLASDDGWLTDDATRNEIVKLLKEGHWYAESDLYNQKWIDANYDFVKLALQATGDSVPPKDRVFAPPKAQ